MEATKHLTSRTKAPDSKGVFEGVITHNPLDGD